MYTAQEPYLLIDNLNQNKVYMCRVAAMTVSKGPYSEVITIELKGYCGMSVNTAVRIGDYRMHICHCIQIQIQNKF